MGNNFEEISPEELEKLLENAMKNVQAQLAKMTPEERAKAEAKAQKLIDDDAADMQKLIDDAKAAAGIPQGEPAAPKFCKSCGAAAEGGKYCAYCGSLL